MFFRELNTLLIFSLAGETNLKERLLLNRYLDI